MKNRKAQISMNTIVYVAIALFILVIIIGFATGALQNLFTGITARTRQIDAAKEDCRIDCQTAQGAVKNYGIGEWEASSYCTDKHPVDVDDNKDTPDEYLSCWEDPIVRSCSVQVRTTENKLMLCATPLQEEEDVTFEACECLEIPEE